ncbi:MAG: AAA family ATPase [Lachnospiraceae bacterium]
MGNTVLKKIQHNVANVMIGKEAVTELLLTALAAGGHVLLEDVPGTGKTVLAKALAKSMDLEFQRVQFTPDLLPSDVTGLSYFNQEKGTFVFKQGPVFSNLLLADEINRATPRTQSSLLECMAEGQVTVDGVTRQLPPPFFVIATQNPVETIGCYPLPEAQMDRFLMKIPMGQLSQDEERQMLERFMTAEPLQTLEAVCTRQEIVSLQEQCRQIYVHPQLCEYIVSLVQATRRAGAAEGEVCGVSPRGTLALLRASQGYAMVKEREFVVPEDIKAVAIPVLAHRCIGEFATEAQKQAVIEKLLQQIPVPTENWARV